MLAMAAERLAKSLYTCIRKELRRGWRAWILAVRQEERKIIVDSYIQFQGLRYLAKALKWLMHVALIKKWVKWVAYAKDETMRLRDILENNAATVIQTRARGMSSSPQQSISHSPFLTVPFSQSLSQLCTFRISCAYMSLTIDICYLPTYLHTSLLTRDSSIIHHIMLFQLYITLCVIYTHPFSSSIHQLCITLCVMCYLPRYGYSHESDSYQTNEEI